MTIRRWSPSRTYTKREEYLLKRLRRTRKLFAFLRDHRHELFDDALQDELVSMYRDTGAGKEPVCPALMAMAVLLQGYLGASDAEAVELTVVDLRWQMVLDCLGTDEPAFSQGALSEFRARLIRHDMDRRLLERSAELARRTQAFDFRKLPKTLRVAIDSSPLEGAGRVEDTVNLLAHAGRKLVSCAAAMLDWTPEQVCKDAGIWLLSDSSVKKALDFTWTDPSDQAEAVTTVVEQLTRLERWVRRELSEAMKHPPLKEHVETVKQLIAQDLEPDPSGGGLRVRDGVAPDRRVSVEDKEMRHGRKSKSKKFNGYKRHIVHDLDAGVILACAITAANRPEEEAVAPLAEDLGAQVASITELKIDRGYVNAPLVAQVIEQGGEVICRPWAGRNGNLFGKRQFKLNVRDRTIACPAGVTEYIEFGTTVEFEPEHCDRCALRSQCTDASPGHGRTVSIADNEPLQQRLRKAAATRKGRERLRERVAVEHALAHVGRRQGRRARYIGVRKNVFDLRRAAAITNMETAQRHAPEPARLRVASRKAA